MKWFTSFWPQVDKLQDILEMLSDVLYLHYHGNLSLSIPDNELSQHRVAFIALSAFAAELLEAVLPVTKVIDVTVLYIKTSVFC